MPPNPNPSTPNVGVRFAMAGATVAGLAAPFVQPLQTSPAPPIMEERSVGDPMVVTEVVLEAKPEAVEARTETKFAQLLGKLDLLGERLGQIGSDVTELKGLVSDLDGKTNNTRVIIVTTVIAAVISIVSVTYGIIGYGHQVADTISAAYSAGQAKK